MLRNQNLSFYGVRDLVKIESGIQEGKADDGQSCDEYGILMLDNRIVHYVVV